MAAHDFKKTYFKHPVWCTYCKEFLWGVTKAQGSKCGVCKAIVHEKCRAIAGQCPGANFYKDKNNRPASAAPGGGNGTTNTSSTTLTNSQQQQQTTTTVPSNVTPPNGGLKCLAKAVFDFPPENERELALKVGDVVEVLRIDDEWWFGVTQDNKEGYFPGSYVEKTGQW